MSDFIDVKKKGTIAQVILNRSKAYNAFNLETITDLTSHLVSLTDKKDYKLLKKSEIPYSIRMQKNSI